MKDGSKGSKYIHFMDMKPKDEKLKDEPCYRVSITEINQKVHILEIPLNSTKLTKTLDLATKVHVTAIQP